MSSRFGNSEGFKAIHLTDKNGARSNGSVSSPPWLGHFTSEWDAAHPREPVTPVPAKSPVAYVFGNPVGEVIGSIKTAG